MIAFHTAQNSLALDAQETNGHERLPCPLIHVHSRLLVYSSPLVVIRQRLLREGTKTKFGVLWMGGWGALGVRVGSRRYSPASIEL